MVAESDRYLKHKGRADVAVLSPPVAPEPQKVLLFANTDWYLYNFRLPLARALRAEGYVVHLISPPGPYAERLVADGFAWHPFDFARRGMNPVEEVWTLARLTALYRRIRPTICHHFTIKCVLYGTVAARLAGARGIINAITGLGHVFVSASQRIGVVRRLIVVLYRAVLRGTCVIFQNADDREAFEKAGVLSRARVHLIRGSGVDVERFRPTTGSATVSDVCRVLFASRLLWEKGLAELIEAADILHRQGVPVRIRIAGASDTGNPSAVPDSEVARWRERPNVDALGHRDDIAALLADSEIVVLPSWREGTPRILLEAAACGLPLVATDVPGCREVVRNEDNGILVPVRDPGALAAALARLAADPVARARMGRRSREIACAEFSQAEVLATTLAIYRSIVLDGR
jgi:glycosyltransferase involved in cell wall biosynthesis